MKDILPTCCRVLGLISIGVSIGLIFPVPHAPLLAKVILGLLGLLVYAAWAREPYQIGKGTK